MPYSVWRGWSHFECNHGKGLSFLASGPVKQRGNREVGTYLLLLNPRFQMPFGMEIDSIKTENNRGITGPNHIRHFTAFSSLYLPELCLLAAGLASRSGGHRQLVDRLSAAAPRQGGGTPPPCCDGLSC
jgi:hypothetical protein